MDTGGEGIPGGMQNTEANPIYSAFSIKFSCSILFEKQVPFFFFMLKTTKILTQSIQETKAPSGEKWLIQGQQV